MLRVLRKDLIKACEFSKLAVSSRTTLPVCECLCFSVKGKTMSITTTDLEVSMVVELDIFSLDSLSNIDYSFIVNMVDLLSYLNAIDDEFVEITLEENYAVKVNDMTFRGTNPEEAPQIPEVADDSHFVIDYNKLFEVMPIIADCTSKDESREVLLSAFLGLDTQGKFCIVSTDTHRMGKVYPDIWEGHTLGTNDINCCLPKTERLMSLLRCIGKQKTNTSLYFNISKKNTVKVEFGLPNMYVKWITRSIESQYPAFDKVIPADDTINYNVSIDKAMLLKVLKASKTVWSDNRNKVQFEYTDNGLNLTCHSADKGTFNKVIPADVTALKDNNLEVGCIKIAFNARYLEEIIKHMGDTIVWEIIGNESPVRIKDNIIGVLMPMQTE